MSESNSRLSSLQAALNESHSKVRELETTLSGKLDQQSADASIREQELRGNHEKIASLEKDLEEHNKGKTELESQLKTTVSLLTIVNYYSNEIMFGFCLSLLFSFDVMVCHISHHHLSQ